MNTKIMRVKKDFVYMDKDGVRNLAGKEFQVDFEVDREEVARQGFEGNWACFNFLCRRNLWEIDKKSLKLYYGHIMDNGVSLGYVMCEDELEEIE